MPYLLVSDPAHLALVPSQLAYMKNMPLSPLPLAWMEPLSIGIISILNLYHYHHLKRQVSSGVVLVKVEVLVAGAAMAVAVGNRVSNVPTQAEAGDNTVGITVPRASADNKIFTNKNFVLYIGYHTNAFQKIALKITSL